MKNIKNNLIAMTLVLVLAVTVCVAIPRLAPAPTPVSAATQEQFLSEVALIYKDTAEEAQAAIQGTGWKLYNKDLNKKAEPVFQDGVFLIYKTSTNVEDAITDLRVMDMYGKYATSNYEQQLADSRAQYLQIVSSLRVVAEEFAEAYEANDEMAKLAYRQLNYYKDVKTEGGTETDKLMGDFFLNMPGDDQVIQVLLEGNALAVSNLIALLTIGISGKNENSVAEKVEVNFEDKESLTSDLYHETASALSKELETIRAKLLRYDTLKLDYDLEDEEISEEEYNFIVQFGALATLMEKIPYGNTNFADFVRLNTWTTQDLYPFVASLTDGQKELVEMGQLEMILQYSNPSKPIEDLYEMLEITEEKLKNDQGEIQPIDVYTGVDREIFKGSFAMTTEAERQQALTGQSWYEQAKKGGLSNLMFVVSMGCFGASGLLAIASIAVGIKWALLNAAANAAEAAFLAETATMEMVETASVAAERFGNFASGVIKAWSIAAVALVLIGVGLKHLSSLYNYYNPDLLDIPTTMIDVKETDLGDKYVKYSVAKVFNPKRGQENADLNAYVGKEWNALYYTKDANAGNCLTPNFVYRENNDTVSKRHQGVSLFGENSAYNLNSNVFNATAPGLYLTVRYSTTKKAAADMPTVVGSMMGGVGYAISGVVGIGLGATGMALFTHLKKKKKEELQEVTTDGE